MINLSLWQLEPTWHNVEELLHRLWGQAADGVYRKDEWAAFHSLVQRVRNEPSGDADEIARHLLNDNSRGVFDWLRQWLARR